MSEPEAKPVPAPAPAAAHTLSAAEGRELRTRGQRSLFIHVLLMFLVSIVVFAIGTYFFVVPHVLRHTLDLMQFDHRLSNVEESVQAIEQAFEDADEEEAPAPAAPAPAPAAPAPAAPAPAAPAAAAPAAAAPAPAAPAPATP